MIDAVRFGVPTIESVIDLLFQMYERLGLLLYRHSHDVDFSSFQSFQSATLDSRLEANLAAWECPTGLAFSHLATVNQVCQEQPLVGGFRDPVIMMKMIKTQSNAASYIPRMLRGRAHGDLHGRNVLVGRVDDRVLWPAIYDFADMSRGNWIGWDFVKLETEFKIRAYPHIFGSDLIRESIQFERNLFEMTEKARRYGDWSVDPTGDPRVARLRCLILQIRRLAGRHLSYQGRHGLWLAEYYFLLTVYGLNAARFHNLTSEELLSAALSSGAAAARFAP